MAIDYGPQVIQEDRSEPDSVLLASILQPVLTFSQLPILIFYKTLIFFFKSTWSCLGDTSVIWNVWALFGSQLKQTL